ncbi:MAG: acylphosphatase [Gammaproteobacteria bacterium]|nr:acylphosphatase [Gammaproteobacteria bacterium]
MSESCKRFLVSGRVQGVFFRASTQREARPLGLRGKAVNLDDGRVEVIACGDAAALDQLQAWLHEGPRMARVENVEVEDIAIADVDVPEGFVTR